LAETLAPLLLGIYRLKESREIYRVS
jgi:hypothetical protein